MSPLFVITASRSVADVHTVDTVVVVAHVTTHVVVDTPDELACFLLPPLPFPELELALEVELLLFSIGHGSFDLPDPPLEPESVFFL